jgi:hypothetical protein
MYKEKSSLGVLEFLFIDKIICGGPHLIDKDHMIPFDPKALVVRREMFEDNAKDTKSNNQ